MAREYVLELTVGVLLDGELIRLLFEEVGGPDLRDRPGPVELHLDRDAARDLLRRIDEQIVATDADCWLEFDFRPEDDPGCELGVVRASRDGWREVARRLARTIALADRLVARPVPGEVGHA